MFKRIIRTITALALASMMSVGGMLAESAIVEAHESEPDSLPPNTSGCIQVAIDGVLINFPDQQPILHPSGRTLVPARGVFEHMGFEVNWCSDTSTATLASGDIVVTIPSGQDAFTANGQLITPDIPQQIVSGRFMLPLRAISEAVGVVVDWDGVNNRVIITTVANDASETSREHLAQRPVFHTPDGWQLDPGNRYYGLIALNSEELLALAEQAPRFHETRSAFTIPNRPVTDEEHEAWRVEYIALGGLNCFEIDVIRLVNEIRVEYGLRPLVICLDLSAAARFHSQDMVDNNFFSHTSPSQSDERGYGGRPHNRTERFAGVGSASENAGSGNWRNGVGGSSTPQERVQSWMNSPGHRAFLLHSQTVAVGVGAAVPHWEGTDIDEAVRAWADGIYVTRGSFRRDLGITFKAAWR
jgi:uncharacterized protein YkwD